MDKILWAGFSMALFAAILTVTKKKPTVSDRLLSAWLFLFAIDYGNLGITAWLTTSPLIPSTFFLFNPAFYLYAKSLTNQDFSLKWKMLLHLVPYVFFELAKLTYPISLNAATFFYPDNELWLRLFYGIALIASIIIYNVSSILIVHRHRLNLPNFFSSILTNHRITWLFFILVAYVLYVFIVCLWGLMDFLNGNFEMSMTFNFLASMLLTFSLGFYGIKQEEIFKNKAPENTTKPSSSHTRYTQSNLSENRKKEIQNLIIDYFNKDKPYLDSELNMSMLSEKLQINKYQLTEVLNTLLGKNFFRFVNDYRIEAAKQKLLDKSFNEYSIEAIGYDCGFSSKSSFFSVFKTATGQTPLQYKKANQKG
jgi:AraC-like DNA-binding protein